LKAENGFQHKHQPGQPTHPKWGLTTHHHVEERRFSAASPSPNKIGLQPLAMPHELPAAEDTRLTGSVAPPRWETGVLAPHQRRHEDLASAVP
jgi:hypothetical protein